jgi:hypothetical protein
MRRARWFSLVWYDAEAQCWKRYHSCTQLPNAEALQRELESEGRAMVIVVSGANLPSLQATMDLLNGTTKEAQR